MTQSVLHSGVHCFVEFIEFSVQCLSLCTCWFVSQDNCHARPEFGMFVSPGTQPSGNPEGHCIPTVETSSTSSIERHKPFPQASVPIACLVESSHPHYSFLFPSASCVDLIRDFQHGRLYNIQFSIRLPHQWANPQTQHSRFFNASYTLTLVPLINPPGGYPWPYCTRRRPL